ncbi:probable RNA-binding protein EIF1AD [Harmonia axyridis]|uniref:probable RNA-binding protein EIF1AD n=1 Tax=Harmonia axyridis TaxID=115357 RepID=UPI001E277002|nr:probable RNA-binding protein EIF1AD [Harmonia axyridis]
MSRATKRKHVLREIDDYSPPTENQQIVKIVESKGNNLHEVETADKTRFLVSMPTKFRKNIWIKRGDFIIIEPIQEGVKVKGEIVRILTSEHIKYYKQDNIWPNFDNNKRQLEEVVDDDLPMNTNRVPAMVEMYSDSDDSDSDNAIDSDSDENEK